MRLSRPLTLLARLCAPLLVPAALAAQVPDSTRADTARADTTRVTKLQEIEVVGSIAPTAGPTIGSGIPARISTVTGEQIDAWEPRLLADALATQPGISLYDDLGSAYKLNLSTRGFNVGPVVGLPPGVSVFLDGVRQNEPDAAEVNFDLLPMEHVRRVELLSGSGSLLGANSLGGAINLITRRGDGPLEGELELSGGSYGAGSGEGSLGGVTAGHTDYYVAGGYEREDGWREATGAHNYNGFVNLGRRGEQRGITFQAFGAESRAETAGSLPESIFDVSPETNFTVGDFEDLDLLQGTVSGYAPVGPGRGAFTAYVRRSHAERFNVNQAPDDNVRSLTTNGTVGGNADWRWTAPARARPVLAPASAPTRRPTGSTSSSSPRIRRTPPTVNADDRRAEPELGRRRLRAGRLPHRPGDAVRRLPLRLHPHPVREPARSHRRHDQQLQPPEPARRRERRPRQRRQRVRVGGSELPRARRARAGLRGRDRGLPAPVRAGRRPAARSGGLDDRRDRRAAGAWPGDPHRIDLPHRGARRHLVHPVGERGVRGVLRRTSAIPGAKAWSSACRWCRANGYRSTPTTPTPTRPIAIRPRSSAPAPARTSPARPSRVRTRSPWATRSRWCRRTRRRPAGWCDCRRGSILDWTCATPARQWLRGDEANETEPLDDYFTTSVRAGYTFGGWEVSAVVNNVFDTHAAIFGTFNENRRTGELERFLTPAGARAVKLVVRREFGG